MSTVPGNTVSDANGDLNARYCATLVDEWVAQGVTRAVVSPGSRSAPIAIAVSRNPAITVDVVLDERSAAFRALGAARVLRAPVVVVCSSGSAAAHFHPAVIEADHGRVPLLVCTADRPSELHSTGAGQTIDQHGLYGTAVRWHCDPGAPDTDRPEFWRSVAARSVQAAAGGAGSSPGPVHLNLAFREPLLGVGDAIGTPGPRRLDGQLVPSAATVGELADLLAGERGLIVVGWGSRLDAATVDALSQRLQWPVFADAISNLRGSESVTRYEAIVRGFGAEAARDALPNVVLRFGAALTSKVTTQWLDASVEHVVIDPHDTWLDPLRAARHRVNADDTAVARAILDAVAPRPASRWYEWWTNTNARTAVTINEVLDERDGLDGALVARDVITHASDGTHLVVASSMPVRDLEWFAPARPGINIHANRGANGIDGLVATATGVATASGAPTVAILGDLAFLHDIGSLTGLAALPIDLTLVVVDNRGGGIFSFLPQAEVCPPEEFEQLFGTPQKVDLPAVVAAHGIPVKVVRDADALRVATGPTANAGVRVVVAETVPRSDEVTRHRQVWTAVAELDLGVPPTVI